MTSEAPNVGAQGYYLSIIRSSKEEDMSPVIEVTRDGLLARRARILEALGLTIDEYYQRAEANVLGGAEWDFRDDLDTIAFLLGGDRFVD